MNSLFLPKIVAETGLAFQRRIMTFKERVYLEVSTTLNQKILALRQTLADLKESASNETKSTAGDKHETALAMLQIEQKNVGSQLENVLVQQQQLTKLIPGITPAQIVAGVVVVTNRGYLFLSIGLGKIIVDGVPVFVLSPKSPLGNKLIGLKVDDTASIQGMEYRIVKIE